MTPYFVYFVSLLLGFKVMQFGHFSSVSSDEAKPHGGENENLAAQRLHKS